MGKLLEIIRFCDREPVRHPQHPVWPVWLRRFRHRAGLASILAGALTMSIMVLPILIRTTEQALLSVPQSYRKGRWRWAPASCTPSSTVLPNAISGILTSVILLGRPRGGRDGRHHLHMGSTIGMPDGIMSSGRSLSVHLYLLAKEGVSV